MTKAPFQRTSSSPVAAPAAAVPRRKSKGTSARSSKSSMASAARPTGLVVPAIGSTSAVDDMASAKPSATALCAGWPITSRAPPIRTAPPSSSAAPIPKTSFRIATRRLKLSSSPMAKSRRMIPSSANGSIACGLEIVKKLSQRNSPVSPPRPDGPTIIPTRMKPMTGEILSRAKAGMTIPAAPRMTRASLKPEVPNSLCMKPIEQAASTLSPRFQTNPPAVMRWRHDVGTRR